MEKKLDNNMPQLFYNEACPSCSLNISRIINHKNFSEEYLIFICEACGFVFEKKNSLYDKNNQADNINKSTALS